MLMADIINTDLCCRTSTLHSDTTMADPIQRKTPSLLQKLLLGISKLIPHHGTGLLGTVSLVARRVVMQGINLYPAPLPPQTPLDNPPDYRTANAHGNDPQHPDAGASNTPFGRNMPPAPPATADARPSVQLVAHKLLARRTFRPAGDQLNILAAAWIQAMSHDWFGHFDADEDIILDQAPSGCPLSSFKFKATKQRSDGFFDNSRTHWWDASFVYGQDDAAVLRARTRQGGKLHVSKTPGILAKDEDGTNLVGDAKNGWLGVAMLQEIFAREHNAVAETIAREHPELAENDDKLFNLARLVVAAVAAKIHTVDWTIELLKTSTLKVGMRTNWFGLPKALGLSKKGPPGALGLVAAEESESHGVPYCLTEEFVSVYRLHPMLPDGLPLPSGYEPLGKLVGLAGEDILNRSSSMPHEVWDTLVRLPCGNLELYNYPSALRDLPPTDNYGRALPENIDLAALDLYRDRERGIRAYNDFRRELKLSAFKNYRDLCGGDVENAKALEEVYGADGIEKVDLMVGMLAEKKIKGFAISETAFLIFLLMASRRLEADRFFTTDFNEKTYTKAGLAWVKSVDGMRDVLARHFPDVANNIPDGYSAFKPRDKWPVV